MSGNTVPASTPSDAKSVFCRLNKTPVAGTATPVEGQSNQFVGQQFTKTILMVPVAGQTQSFTYGSRARMELVQYTKDQYGNKSNFTILETATIGSYGPTERASGTVSYTMSGLTLTGATITGFMPARTDAMGVAITDQEKWNVSYVRTPEADSVVKYALSGAITALKGGAEVGSVALQDGSFIRAVPVNGHVVSQNVKEVNLALAVGGANSKVVGTLSLSNFSTDKNGSNYAPTDLKFIGSFTNASSEFFNGTLTAKASNYAAYDNSLTDSATNFVKASGSFTGIFRIPGRPDLKLTLSVYNPEFNLANFSGQYDDGTNTILISSSNASPKVINISSANGVSVQFNEGVNTADVLKNSSKIAVFDRATGIITYNDGSFESLK